MFLAILVQCLWGLGFTLSKAGTGQFPPIFLMGCRYALAAVVLIWFVRGPGRLAWRLFLIAAVSGTIPYGMVFTGLSQLHASTAILLVQLNVPFLAILGWLLLKETMGWRRVVGMAVAFGGVGLIAGEPHVYGNPVPLVLVVGGGLVWAFGQTMIRRLGEQSGMWLLAWIAGFSAPQLFALSFLLESGHENAVRTAGIVDWAIVLYVGLIMTALAYTVWYHLLGRCEVNQVAPFMLLNPVVGVLAGVVLLGENLTPMVVLGGAVVIAGIGVMTIHWKPRTQMPG